MVSPCNTKKNIKYVGYNPTEWTYYVPAFNAGTMDKVSDIAEGFGGAVGKDDAGRSGDDGMHRHVKGGIRSHARVLEFAHEVEWDEAEIPVGSKGAERFLARIGFSMLFYRDTKQVVETVVGCDAVEVMDLMAGRDG